MPQTYPATSTTQATPGPKFTPTAEATQLDETQGPTEVLSGLGNQPASLVKIHDLHQARRKMLRMHHNAVLVTGMSGVGKSTALAELARRGFTTVDTDCGPWIHVAEGEPLWREPLIHSLLDRPRKAPLFVQGTVANQARFYSRFDAILLLSAPIEVIFDRLDSRTNNPFGKTTRRTPTNRRRHSQGRATAAPGRNARDRHQPTSIGGSRHVDEHRPRCDTNLVSQLI